LERDAGVLWPAAALRYPPDFRWDVLADHRDGGGRDEVGVRRFNSQYWRANVDPSDRYVLSLPGTARYRLRPGDSGVANLFLAGDWTECGLDAGCVEAAVTSGLLAGNAMCGKPALGEIVGHDHLRGPR
ncbi:MAG: FAD-dependent oxidoreductase, partial [Frankiaceae bacterium]